MNNRRASWSILLPKVQKIFVEIPFMEPRVTGFPACETQHPSRFDNYELDFEAYVSKRSDCGKDIPKRKPEVHQIPRH